MTVAYAEPATVPESAIARVLRHVTRSNVVPIALLLEILIATGDFVTGVEVTFTLLYILPVGLAAWFRGRRFGRLLAVLSACSSLGGDVTYRLVHGWHLHTVTLTWNHAGALVLFLLWVEVLDRLRGYVEREARERRLAVDQLRHAERLNLIGKLAAGVAHELGTPINVIAGNAELLDADDVTREMLHVRATRILNQTYRMTRIIQQLLDFGRRSGSGRELVEVGRFVLETAELMRPIVEKLARLEVAGTDQVIRVRANRLELGQVVANLVMNGLAAMPDGGLLTISCSIKRRSSGAPEASISVSDTGTGIPPEDVPRIFDPFFTTKEPGSGTGLGLSVAYGIVRDHDGHIGVDTELGKGSRFTVSLPLANDLG
jgi:signal transduction histidine kinase